MNYLLRKVEFLNWLHYIIRQVKLRIETSLVKNSLNWNLLNILRLLYDVLMVFERKKAGQANEDADSDTPEVKAPGPILQLYLPQLPV